MNLTPWNQYKDFSSEFLKTHRDLILWETYYYLQAFLLFPPDCEFDVLRERIVLALKTGFYNQALQKNADEVKLRAIRFLWKIPEDRVYRETYSDTYPIWLIERTFTERAVESHFQIVSRVVWTLLRLAQTYESVPPRVFQASLKEAVEIILGKNPLKRKSSHKTDYLGGEKAYFTCFNRYKPVCHIVTAFEFTKEKYRTSVLTAPAQIEYFLKLAKKLRRELLYIQTPNVKMKSLFPSEILLTLPDWINEDNTSISLEPYAEKLAEIQAQYDQDFNISGNKSVAT